MNKKEIENQYKKKIKLINNYNSSEWYKKTYSIFDKMYYENKIIEKKSKKKSILDKFKSLFN